MSEQLNSSRRDFLKKTAYVVPAVLTLKAAPALAGQGSYHHKDRDKHKHKYDKHKDYNKHTKYDDHKYSNKKDNKYGKKGW
jgi:hypothetical protein